MNLPFNIFFGMRLDLFLPWIAIIIVCGIAISIIFKSALSGAKEKIMVTVNLLIASLLSNFTYSAINQQLKSMISGYNPSEIYNDSKSLFTAIILFAVVCIINFLFIKFFLYENEKLSLIITLSIISLPWICFLPIGDISTDCNYLLIAVVNKNFWIFALFALVMSIIAFIINRKSVSGIKNSIIYILKLIFTSFLSMGLVSYTANFAAVNYIYSDVGSVIRAFLIFVVVFAIMYLFNRFCLYKDKNNRFVLISSAFTAPWFMFLLGI